jgi:hypothetical protein
MLTCTDASDARAARGFEQRERVPDGPGVREIGVIEPHPVCVHQHAGALRREDERVRTIEVVRMDVHRSAKRVFAVR